MPVLPGRRTGADGRGVGDGRGARPRRCRPRRRPSRRRRVRAGPGPCRPPRPGRPGVRAGGRVAGRLGRAADRPRPVVGRGARVPVLARTGAGSVPAGGAEYAGGKDRPRPPKSESGPRPAKAGEQTPEQILAAGWRSARRGLFWVQFALLWIALVGFVGFGKAVMVRSGNELPKGDGADWVSIEGYVNDANNANAVTLNKPDLLNLGLYAVPVFIAGVCVVFGRLIASGAPRSSGARGLFGLSALFALIGVAGLFGSFIFERLLMRDEYRYTWTAYVLLLPLAEFWFLTGLSACGLALKRPRAARAVGAVGFVVALGVFAILLGWDLYKQFGRPKPVDADLLMYEQAALMLGWLLLVGVYWRAVRNVRSAAQEYIDTVEGVA